MGLGTPAPSMHVVKLQCLTLSPFLQENLRQLCVWKLGNDAGQPWHWWEYVTAFGEQCQMADENYNQECAEQVHSVLQSGGNTLLLVFGQ